MKLNIICSKETPCGKCMLLAGSGTQSYLSSCSLFQESSLSKIFVVVTPTKVPEGPSCSRHLERFFSVRQWQNPSFSPNTLPLFAAKRTGSVAGQDPDIFFRLSVVPWASCRLKICPSGKLVPAFQSPHRDLFASHGLWLLTWTSSSSGTPNPRAHDSLGHKHPEITPALTVQVSVSAMDGYEPDSQFNWACRMRSWLSSRIFLRRSCWSLLEPGRFLLLTSQGFSAHDESPHEHPSEQPSHMPPAATLRAPLHT